jgi:hypothetical protein
VKLWKTIGAVCALGLALAVPAQGAVAGAGEAWTVAVSPDGVFSVETPCTASEVAGMDYMPEDTLPGVTLDKKTRVICFKGGMMYLGVVLKVGTPPKGESMFDALVESVANSNDVKGSPKQATIGGRRALVNRAGDDGDGIVAQTGFVELNPREILFLFSGGEGKSVSVADQAKAIDRFFGSAKVIAQ